MVPHGDEQWYDIVKTVMAIIIYAEAFGVTSATVPGAVTGDTAVDRLFGLEGSYGQETLRPQPHRGPGRNPRAGQLRRDLRAAPDAPGLEREGSRNALWNNAPCQDCPKGGQIYAAPLR